jgi:hypothetical protein
MELGTLMLSLTATLYIIALCSPLRPKTSDMWEQRSAGLGTKSDCAGEGQQLFISQLVSDTLKRRFTE